MRKIFNLYVVSCVYLTMEKVHSKLRFINFWDSD